MLPYSIMNLRTQKAKQMMQTSSYVSQIDYNSFKVRSQANPENHYIVSRTGSGLICECKDHSIRKSDCKHIKIVLDVIRNNQCHKTTHSGSWNAQN